MLIDLEGEICAHYTGRSDLLLDPGQLPTMEQVARRPRSELHQIWTQTAARASEAVATSTEVGPRVMALHLSWYNSSTSEFYSPVIDEPLRQGNFDRVVVVIDDIYDMFTRLQGPADIYEPEALDRRARQLAKLAYPGQRNSAGAYMLEEDEKAARLIQAQLRAKESAVMHLLAWRRAEMVRAENLALALGAKLHLFASKHAFAALRLLLTEPHLDPIYLSHRITEPRMANKDSANLPDDLGTWPPVVHEVNNLHVSLAERGRVLVCPTAIDELRFATPTALTTNPPFLSSRWPLPDDIDSLAWPQIDDFQHTMFFSPPGVSPDDPVASGVVRSVADQIFFEIAFRDHYIVEHIESLLVYRPFYSHDLTEIENIDWSGGVRPEILHWQKHAISPHDDRDHTYRVAFVHSLDEMRARLGWLAGDRYDNRFVRFVRSHLEQKLKSESFPDDEIVALMQGTIPTAQVTHLDMNPQVHTTRRARSVVGWIESFGLAAVHELFSMSQRPHAPVDGAAQFEIAMLCDHEFERQLEDLDGISTDLAAFFGGQVSGIDASRKFNDLVSREFLNVFGLTLEDAAFAAVGLQRTHLITQ